MTRRDLRCKISKFGNIIQGIFIHHRLKSTVNLERKLICYRPCIHALQWQLGIGIYLQQMLTLTSKRLANESLELSHMSPLVAGGGSFFAGDSPRRLLREKSCNWSCKWWSAAFAMCIDFYTILLLVCIVPLQPLGKAVPILAATAILNRPT